MFYQNKFLYHILFQKLRLILTTLGAKLLRTSDWALERFALWADLYKLLNAICDLIFFITNLA